MGMRRDSAFSINDVYDLSRRGVSDAGWQARDVHAAEEAAVLGHANPAFLSGMSEAAVREFLRLALRRVRSRAELDRLRARYVAFLAYFPPPRGEASRGAA